MKLEVPHTSPPGKLEVESNGARALLRLDGIVLADGIDCAAAAYAFLCIGADAGHGPSKKLRALAQQS